MSGVYPHCHYRMNGTPPITNPTTLKFSNKHHYVNLDVLRLVLALLVVTFHIPTISRNMGLPYFNEWPILNRGNEAVHWFFVLSGFLLSHLAVKEVHNGGFHLLQFIQRRILRIWPLYFIVTIFGIFFYYYLLPALHIPFNNHASLNTTLVLSFLFLSNVLHALYDPGGILTITWSVSVEEQFYLIFPFLVVLAYRNRWSRWILLTGLFLFFVFLHLSGSFLSAILNKVGLFFELFLLGAIAAECLPFFGQKHAQFRLPLLLVLLTLTFLLFFTNWLMPVGQPLLWRLLHGITAAGVILLLATTTFITRAKWLLVGGKISYGIYMYHMIVITGMVFLLSKMPPLGIWAVWIMNIGSILLTYLLAFCSYYAIESRFLRMKRY